MANSYKKEILELLFDYLPPLGKTLNNLIGLINDNTNNYNLETESESEFFQQLSGNLDATIKSLRKLVDKTSEIILSISEDTEQTKEKVERNKIAIGILTFLHMEVIEPNLVAIEALLGWLRTDDPSPDDIDFRLVVDKLLEGSKKLVEFTNEVSEMEDSD